MWLHATVKVFEVGHRIHEENLSTYTKVPKSVNRKELHELFIYIMIM